jgi:hypothetical protein
MSNSNPSNPIVALGACLLVAGVLAVPVMGWLPLVAVAGTVAVIVFSSKAR